MKTGPRLARVRALHAEFHRQAGQVLTLALSGRKPEAQAAMEPKGSFTLASNQLTDELVGWMREAA